MPAGWSYMYSKCTKTEKLCYKHTRSGAVQWDRPLEAPSAMALPEGWRAACKTTGGRIRYEHLIETRSLQWEKPDPPPAGWTMPAGWSYSKCSDSQKLCYKHLLSGRVQWERPYTRGCKRPYDSPLDVNAGEGGVLFVAARTRSEEAADARRKLHVAMDRGEVIDLDDDVSTSRQLIRKRARLLRS